MTADHTMDAPDERRRLDDMAQSSVGAAMDRPDGPLKVSGTATYAHEWQLDGCAEGVLVRATVPKGTLTALDRAAVEAMPGVLGVFSDDRFLRNPAQGTANRAPVQGASVIEYLGQPIALVVAETFEQARHGAENLRAVFERADDAVVDPEMVGIELERPPGVPVEQGDLDGAMRDAAFTVDAVYRTPGHNSAPMEPHCSIASWDGDELTVRGSYQMLKYARSTLADALDIDPANVRVVSPYVGGGFGSKLGIASEAVAAAIAARELDRPVRATMSRQQVFEAVIRRSETRQRMRLAADAQGRLTGVGHESLVFNLPGEAFAEPVSQATHFMYRGEHRRVGIDLARVNRTCAGSVRAPGEAVGVPALESAMDELAVATGIDPVELRKRNVPEQHPESDIPYSSGRFVDALDEGARRFGWEHHDPTPGIRRDGEWLVGTGMAGAARVNMLMEAEARATLHADATVTVESDMTDIGTGTYAVLTQVASDMLGVPAGRVHASLGDTAFPPGSGSGGSFGASSCGSAVFLACQDVRRQLAGRLGCDEEELDLRDGMATPPDGEPVSLPDLLGGNALSADGHIHPGKTSEAVQQATYGSYFAEVGVSAVTGETRVRRMTGVFSAGRILNRKTATSQCHGGMVFGIGMALTEALVHDPRDGHVTNRDFAEYHIPTNLDAPQLDVVLLDERDDWASPIQAKGIGELSICGAAAAITNAIYNASGVRVRDYPATLDKVLAGLPSR